MLGIGAVSETELLPCKNIFLIFDTKILKNVPNIQIIIILQHHHHHHVVGNSLKRHLSINSPPTSEGQLVCHRRNYPSVDIKEYLSICFFPVCSIDLVNVSCLSLDLLKISCLSKQSDKYQVRWGSSCLSVMKSSVCKY